MKDAGILFNDLRCEPCRVHAEVQLVHEYESRRAKGADAGRVHPYIRSSKLCCYLCSSFIRRHGFFNYRGCHWKFYHRWLVSTAFAAAQTTRIFEETLRGVFKEMNGHVRSLMEGEELPSKEAPRPETTLDMSSRATVSSRDLSEMTLKSPWSERMFKGYADPLRGSFRSIV